MTAALKTVLVLTSISVVLSGSLEDRAAGSLSFSEIARLVAANVDQNKDGNLTLAEIYNSLITRFDHDGDGCAEKQEFVKQWSHDYHDNPHISGLFFDHLDLDQDGCLTKTDIDFNFRAMDSAHGDHSVTEAEFASFLAAVHPNVNSGSVVG